jgi:hypothetical protein
MAATAVDSTSDVFINCPFDSDYSPIFRAVVFVIFACSFRARSALEVDDASDSRLEKLYGIMKTCRYGIHDISRTEPDAHNGLPRFNMPLELGIFLGAKKFGNAQQRLKRALVLDIEQYRYQRFVSDLAGADIHRHNGDPADAIMEVRNWLANVSRRMLPSANKLTGLYIRFSEDLTEIAKELEFEVDGIPYVDYERIVTQWLIKAPVA